MERAGQVEVDVLDGRGGRFRERAAVRGVDEPVPSDVTISLGIPSAATASVALGLRPVSWRAERRGTRMAWRSRTWRIAPVFHGLGRREPMSAGEEIIASARQGSSGWRARAWAAIEPPIESPSTANRS